MATFVAFTGRLVYDPVLRYEPDETPVVTISVSTGAVAVGDPAATDLPTHVVEIRGQAAEHAAETLLWDTHVVVHGTAEPGTYVDDDGQVVPVLNVQAAAVGPDLRYASARVLSPERPRDPNEPSPWATQ